MNKALVAKIEEWSHPPFDNETIETLEEMKNYPQELEDAFYKNLEFEQEECAELWELAQIGLMLILWGKAPKGSQITSNKLLKMTPLK